MMQKTTAHINDEYWKGYGWFCWNLEVVSENNAFGLKNNFQMPVDCEKSERLTR